MGITLVTPSLPNVASNSNAGQSSDPVASGFAELLSLQLVDLAKLLPAVQTPAENKKVADSNEETSADPAQILAGMPPLIDVMSRQVSSAGTGKEKLALDIEADGRSKRTPELVLQTDPNSTAAQKNTPASTTIDGKREPLTAANFAANSLATPISRSTDNEAVHNDFANTLAAQVAHSNNAARTTAGSSTIPTPLQDVRWAQDFGEKVVWMTRNDQQSAQISINPPQLGPLQISISLNGDQATAIFTSAHAEVRQAIEDALPRLREMLAGAGIDLGQTNVGSQLAQQQAEKQAAGQDAPRFGNDNAILGGDSSQTASSSVSALRSGRGLVDLFA